MTFISKSVSVFLSGVALMTLPVSAMAGEATTIALVSTSVHAEYTGTVNRGFDAIRKGKPEQAVRLFDTVIEQNDKMLGTDLRPRLCNSDSTAASAAADSVVISSAVCDAHFGKGFALVDLGRGDLAEAELRRATELAPSNAHYANEYAELFKSRREWQRSYDGFAHAWSVVDKQADGPDRTIAARSLRGMGYNMIEMGKLDEAESYFTQSLAYEPNSDAAKNELKFIAQRKAIGI